MTDERLTRLQERVAHWQRRSGTRTVVVWITAAAIVISCVICFTVFFAIYGGVGGAFEAVGLVGTILPILAPLLTAPVVTFSTIRALATAANLIEELDETRQALQVEIDARRAAQVQLEKLVHHDPLTGVLNRRGFFTSVEQRQAQGLQDVVVVTIDVDQFKAVNDTHGHAAGDRSLCAVADALTAVAGADAIVGRLGGDEFVAAIPGADFADGAVDAALADLELASPAGVAFDLRCSVGIARHCDEQSLDVTMVLADMAMYEQKLARRSRRTRTSVVHSGRSVGI